MPPLGVSNDVLIEIFRFCTYNDLNALALTSRQLQAIQLDNAPIARMHCLEVSSQGFTLHYSPNSPRKRLFPSFDEFADCARKVRPKIHIMELVNEYFSEVEDCFLRKVFTAEVYRIRTNIVDPMLHLRFYCKGVMYESLWDMRRFVSTKKIAIHCYINATL
uniref:F-box domain-containing protein n=1 Tax=Ditylenchus dipsaci TaxID=166011 RepID=A0A915EJF1_9BILA